MRGRLAWAAWLLVCAAPAAAQQGPPALPIEVEAQAIELDVSGNRYRFQGEVVARYGAQQLTAQEVELVWEGEGRWRLGATGGVHVSDPGFEGTAEALAVALRDEGGGLRPERIELEAFQLTVEGEGGAQRFSAARGALALDGEALEAVELAGGAEVALQGVTLEAEQIALRREADGWAVEASGAVRFTGADQAVGSEALSLALREAGGRTQVDAAELQGFSGAGTFTNAVGERHDIRYEGARASFAFEGERLRRITLREARLTTCTCAGTIAQASYALAGREVTLWPDEWVFGREITLSASGVPLFWLPLFFAPLQEIDFEGSEFIPEVGRDAQRGWFARWRLPLFADPGNRGTFLLDYYNRFAETGLGVDWGYTLPVQTQSGRLRVYHLVGRHQLLELDWRHAWPLSSVAELAWSLSRRDVTPPAAGPSRWAYDVQLAGQAAGWQWRAGAVREETTQQEREDQAARFQALERVPELSLSHAGGWTQAPLRYSGSLAWGRYREQRGADEAYLTRDRLDAALNLTLAQLAVQSAPLRFGASGGVRHSRYGEGLARTSSQLQLDGHWAPGPDLSASARYLVRTVQGKSPFAFDALEVADVLSGQLQFSRGVVRGSLSAGYGFGAGRLDPTALTLSAALGAHALQATAQTLPGGFELAHVRLQHDWTAPWGRWSLAGGYQVPTGRFEDVIARLALERVKLGARVDPNRPALLRTNAQFDVRLGAWSLEFNCEYDWSLHRFSALQLGLVHHFCKDCWQAGVYLSGGRVWLQVQINAFPGAGVNYSPTDGALGFN